MDLIFLAGLLLLPLLYLPGWAVSFLAASPADPLKRHFERILVGALWHGWLALVLASLGIFSLWLQLGVSLVVGVLVVLWGVRVRRGREPLRRQRASRDERRRQLYEGLAYGAVLLVTLATVVRPFETVVGVRDAGVYATTGLAIARTGTLVQDDAVVAGWGQDAASPDETLAGPARQAITNYMISQPRERFIASRLRAAGFFIYEGELEEGRVVPQGLHLLPAWIALLASIGGPYLGMFAPGLLGLLAVWSVGMLGRHLAGFWVGLLAMALLALNGVQVWFARYSTAETSAQLLIWAGLYFFAAMQTARAVPVDELRARHEPTPVFYGLLAGLAIGQVALTRIDFFLLGPVVLYLLYCWLSRRWTRAQTALAVGLGLMLLHAGLHIGLIARAYFFDTGHDRFQDSALIALFSLPFLSEPVRETFLTSSALARPGRIWIELGLALAGAALLVALRLYPAPLHRLETWLTRRREWLLQGVMIGILLLGAYGYLIRPQIITADLLFNTNGGWNDPLTRDPELVAEDIRAGRLTHNEARTLAGVVMEPHPQWWIVTPKLDATAATRERLMAERGPWAGPFSNQTINWLRLQGYVGAPIRLPVSYWYNEYAEMNWLEQRLVDPATLTSAPVPLKDKYTIPLANMVRMGWYLSPLGVLLGVVGYALWWRRDLNAASWLWLTVAFIGTFFFIRQTYGTSDQHYIYILRRFVPIAYPAFSLSIAYALVALASLGRRTRTRRLTAAFAGGLAGLLLFFLAWTNRPIFAHVEYRGAIAQLEVAASQFTPGRDVLLMRGGAPIHAESRDIPDMVATPLRFIYGIDAFAVKSSQPGNYAEDLAAAAQRLRDQGREVYLLLSASGGSFVLPGFALEPAGGFSLDLPEFEQLSDQKPRNVSSLQLPFNIYRLVPAAPGVLGVQPPPLAPDAFSAQVVGFYRPERDRDGTAFVWTNGKATLRIPWSGAGSPGALTLDLSAGSRPAHLGPAEVCLSAVPEGAPWPVTTGEPVELGCYTVEDRPGTVTIQLDPTQLPPAPGGTLLLHLNSPGWVPAAEDPRQSDQRTVGVRFHRVWITGAAVP
ncbi:hypothetical protein EYB53_006485 [Candidatus Chloroploca sp. M-50]|uniref:Glycosyltransferase RgtA/B/C/D-like domain-containing protein n=1 Tax=Candidatus Chloroploca mongolica TaxID=2528176 RepID=A0ABS4D7C7_9CHLR|nr:hypothetical protein [Candidatus Chloroploca mongolica]MBP1465347.1 hypothetical protein [Candidatus Chloroploca mongolica]